jgi:hypothetical protein
MYMYIYIYTYIAACAAVEMSENISGLPQLVILIYYNQFLRSPIASMFMHPTTQHVAYGIVVRAAAHVCMHVCMCVCVCVRMSVCVHILHMCVYIYIMRAHTYTYLVHSYIFVIIIVYT